MTVVVDPDFLEKLDDYGAFDIHSCFNCGNCTAVCPLSEGRDSFPRRMIRYSQLGDRGRVLSSKELWLCYYCGECSDTCPREAEPGEFMAAARRYAIASFDPTGISSLLYRSKTFTWIFLAFLSALLALLFLHERGPIPQGKPGFFAFLPFELVHTVGLAVIGIALLALTGGLLRMILHLKRALPGPEGEDSGEKKKGRLKRAIAGVLEELALQERFHDCNGEDRDPWYRSRRFLHWSIMWGFIGLGVATGLDYLLLLVAGKVPGQPVPLWHPTRLLGTVAGIFLVWGTSWTLGLRIVKPDKYYSRSLLSDWLFVAFLWLAGVTGFLVEISLYLPRAGTWMYAVFLVHVVVSMEVVLLFPFTKFSHAAYRPIALFVLDWVRAGREG